jgi:hypothetical protein
MIPVAREVECAMTDWLKDKGKGSPPPLFTGSECGAWENGYRDALRDVAAHFDVRVVQR